MKNIMFLILLMLSGKVFGLQCPDDEAGLVILTPMIVDSPVIKPVVDDLIDAAASAADRAGLTILVIPGEAATILAYRAFAQCPNIKAFFNIAHGDVSYMEAADGKLTAKEIGDMFKFNHKTFFYNFSCHGFENPIKDAFISKAKASRYVGPMGSCTVGEHIDTYVTLCFWDSAFTSTDFTSLIGDCEAEYQDKFPGQKTRFKVGGNGRPFIMSPLMAETILDRSEL